VGEPVRHEERVNEEEHRAGDRHPLPARLALLEVRGHSLQVDGRGLQVHGRSRQSQGSEPIRVGPPAIAIAGVTSAAGRTGDVARAGTGFLITLLTVRIFVTPVIVRLMAAAGILPVPVTSTARIGLVHGSPLRRLRPTLDE
jgi:hypothetical protein